MKLCPLITTHGIGRNPERHGKMGCFSSFAPNLIRENYHEKFKTLRDEIAGRKYRGISHTRVAVLCMEIDHLSGKEAIELVRAHK